MGHAAILVGSARAIGQRMLPIALSLLLAWCASTSLLVRTAAGVHCPTAPVQQVVVVDKSCCPVVEVRKPQLGGQVLCPMPMR